MPSLKRCVLVVNSRSGRRHAVQTFASTLKGYLDRAGIVHHDVHIPNDDAAEQLQRALPWAEALVLCGGDGTVNRALNLIASMSFTGTGPGREVSPRSLLEAVPLLLVPTGLHNSIATSLGVTSAERAVSSLVVGRTARVPLWAVHLRRPHSSSSAFPMRYMCSYVSTGTYAASVQRQSSWKEAQEDYVFLPAGLRGFAATALFTTIEHTQPNSTAVLTHMSNKGVASSKVGPLRLLVASQMPQLQPGYSLTPTATYHRRQLTVTTATAEVSRLRMWHLLHREAREGCILAEDGVAMQEGVRGVRIDFASISELSDAATSSTQLPVNDEGEGSPESSLLMVDGEAVQVPAGSSVTVTPTELSVQLIVC
ncbi:Diacylglycerol kinase catalytic domain containing protein [Leishmania braziliensis]|nr:Diacylglycerol kinase catalytic domain containing protein [Leishmania braziliensis]